MHHQRSIQTQVLFEVEAEGDLSLSPPLPLLTLCMVKSVRHRLIYLNNLLPDVPIEALAWKVDIYVLPRSPQNAAITDSSHVGSASMIS
ncbi:hypothetical protein GCK32_012915 [Trichostrongylus colubriformis]|uniref:Uncharacterized protein n=1 Tax=Trichostrongylus colubriformis TaxID=6319 RepID=A0AAN8G5M3_TRICO